MLAFFSKIMTDLLMINGRFSDCTVTKEDIKMINSWLAYAHKENEGTLILSREDTSDMYYAGQRKVERNTITRDIFKDYDKVTHPYHENNIDLTEVPKN